MATKFIFNYGNTELTFYDYFYSNHVFKTFCVWPFFHKPYGFDTALRQTTKPHNFYPPHFLKFLSFLEKSINLLSIQQFTIL